MIKPNLLRTLTVQISVFTTACGNWLWTPGWQVFRSGHLKFEFYLQHQKEQQAVWICWFATTGAAWYNLMRESKFLFLCKKKIVIRGIIRQVRVPALMMDIIMMSCKFTNHKKFKKYVQCQIFQKQEDNYAEKGVTLASMETTLHFPFVFAWIKISSHTMNYKPLMAMERSSFPRPRC